MADTSSFISISAAEGETVFLAADLLGMSQVPFDERPPDWRDLAAFRERFMELAEEKGELLLVAMAMAALYRARQQVNDLAMDASTAAASCFFDEAEYLSACRFAACSS